jgi:SAM-dependent methyltransferase
LISDVKLVRLDPPGLWCSHEAVYDAIARCGGRTFLEVGCGAGRLSRPLCERGLTGRGLDVSPEAVDEAREHLRDFIAAGRFELDQGDLFALEPDHARYDLGLSLMVMEHVENDVGFVARIAEFVRPGGHVIIGVPGRRDRWGIEDETVGHWRRYDRVDLSRVLERAGLRQVEVWSVAVPVANLLFRAGNLMLRLAGEGKKATLPRQAQTAASGVRHIPFKTMFPSAFRFVLNGRTLHPLLVLQRLFYHSNLGLTLIGFGERP